MNTKYLIALFLLVLTAQSLQVSVGDSEEFRDPALMSVYKVPGLGEN